MITRAEILDIKSLATKQLLPALPEDAGQRRLARLDVAADADPLVVV